MENVNEKLSEREIQLMELKCRLDSLNSSSEELAKELTTEKIEELNSLMNNLSLVLSMQRDKLNMFTRENRTKSGKLNKQANEQFRLSTSIKNSSMIRAIELLTKI